MCGPWGFLIQLYSLDPATLLGQTPPEELSSFPLACPPKFMFWIPGWWQPPAELLVWSVSGQISSHLRHHLHGPYSLYDRISKGIQKCHCEGRCEPLWSAGHYRGTEALEKKTTRVSEISTEENYQAFYFSSEHLQGIALYYSFLPWSLL